jgi:hypothetical protein
MCSGDKKSAEMFGSSGFSSYLCRMNDEKWVITGVNVLTKCREEISGPMSREAAEARCEREKINRSYQRYKTHNRLRVEKRLPVQLTIKFNEYE